MQSDTDPALLPGPSSKARFHPLVDLYNDRAANQISGFAERARALDPVHLAELYEDLRQKAPRRHRRGKSYLMGGRTGAPTPSPQREPPDSNRIEEHLAMALFNARDDRWTLSGAKTLRIVDYQTPLKERRDNRGVGKIDLLGIVDDCRLAVTELKVRARKGLGDTPLRAFLEGLAYCAILHANAPDVANELSSKHGVSMIDLPPTLIIAAPTSYWSAYLTHKRAGEWLPSLQMLASRVEASSGVTTHFLTLGEVSPQMGTARRAPSLKGDLEISPVEELLSNPTESTGQ